MKSEAKETVGAHRRRHATTASARAGRDVPRTDADGAMYCTRLDDLPAALDRKEEWMARAEVAVSALAQQGVSVAHVVVCPLAGGAAALNLVIDADLSRCTTMAHTVHSALARKFDHVLPSTLLLRVIPLDGDPVALRQPGRDPSSLADETAALACRLSSSTGEVDWRQAALTAYLLALNEATRVSARICPENQNLLTSQHDRTLWRLRLSRSQTARTVAEALATMRQTFLEAAFGLGRHFTQFEARLQCIAMEHVRADLRRLDTEGD